MTSSMLKIEINNLPNNLKEEVANFVAFLKSKTTKGSKLKTREFGYAKGKIKLSNDFDAPLKEFGNYI